MAAALFLDSAKNLSQIILAKLYGITRLAIHKVLQGNAPHSEAKFTRKSLLPNYAVLP